MKLDIASAAANRKLRGLFLLALLLMGGIILAAVLNMLSVQSNNKLRAASVDRLLQLEAVQTSLLQLEASQRAYLLTGHDDFAAELRNYRSAIDTSLQQLVSLPASDSGVDYAPLLASAHERIDAMDAVLTAYESDGFDAARTQVESGTGKALMDRYRDINAGLEQVEMDFLAQARAQTEAGSRRLLWLLGSWMLANLAMLSIGVNIVRRDRALLNTLMLEQQQAGDDLQQLNNLNASLLSCTDHGEACRIIGHFLQRLFPDVAGALYLYRSSRNVLEQHGGWGQLTGDVPPRILSEECWALRRGTLHQWRDRGDLACAHYGADQHRHPSLCLPMMALGETLGLLYVQGTSVAADHEGFFDAARLQLLQTTASQIASAVANLNLRAALHSQSIRDPLTGLYNRRYLEETMQREEMRARRSGQPMSIVMADIDHFKQYNDTQGHQAGDSLLQSFGEVLGRVVRDEDIACRYGGEEFILVLPGAALEKAMQRAEEVRTAVMRLRARQGGRSLPDVTASFGVASFPQHGDQWRDVLRQADQALYAAKQQGRNRCVAADGSAD